MGLQGRADLQGVADRPNAPWVSDFTYVSTSAGFVCVAFIIDEYARRLERVELGPR